MQAGACLRPAVSILQACSLHAGTKGTEEEKETPAAPVLGRQGWTIMVRTWRMAQSTGATGARGMQDQPRLPCARSGASGVAELRNEPGKRDLSSLLVCNRWAPGASLPTMGPSPVTPDSTSLTQNFQSKPHKMVLLLRLLGSSYLTQASL